MKFVLSAFRPMSAALLTYPRLYAFPRQPDPPGEADFIILDSGAFALSCYGGRMTAKHKADLAVYYAAHGGPKVLCIAPDVYLDPRQTMRNFLDWQRAGKHSVVPVFQTTRARYFDLRSFREQAACYASFALPKLFGRPVVAIGDPSLSANECGNALLHACEIIRQKIPDAWVHVLGAGWSREDVEAWRRLGCVDSIDSIAYYEDARAGIVWQGAKPGKNWRETAVNNALVAIAAAGE